MKSMRRYAGAFLAVVVLLCALTACHSSSGTTDTANVKNEDTAHVKNEVDKGAETQMTTGAWQAQTQLAAVPPGQLGKMGEPIGAMDLQDGNIVADALFYTINKAAIFDNYEMAGIEPDAMGSIFTDENLTDADGGLRPGIKFLLIEITVQNVSAVPEQNISELRMLSVENGSGVSENTEVSLCEAYPSTPAFFSNPTGKRIGDDWKEYFNYKLPAGQSKTLKVGWYVDTEQYDVQNLYLTFNYDEYQKYIRIEY